MQTALIRPDSKKSNERQDQQSVHFLIPKTIAFPFIVASQV